MHVRAAYEARAAFRRELSEFVRELRTERAPLPFALRHTRAMLQRLQTSGAIEDDGGWMEAEVLEWVIQLYEVAD